MKNCLNPKISFFTQKPPVPRGGLKLKNNSLLRFYLGGLFYNNHFKFSIKITPLVPPLITRKYVGVEWSITSWKLNVMFYI